MRAAARTIRARLRSYDPAVRVGGDEFICALPGVDLNQASLIFDDIQRTLSETRPGTSMSFGLAALAPNESMASLIRRSDDKLRDAKAALR